MLNLNTKCIVLFKEITIIQKINILSGKIKSLMDYSTLSLKNSIAFIHSESEKAISPYEANGKVSGNKLQSTMVSVDA